MNINVKNPDHFKFIVSQEKQMIKNTMRKVLSESATKLEKTRSKFEIEKR